MNYVANVKFDHCVTSIKFVDFFIIIIMLMKNIKINC